MMDQRETQAALNRIDAADSLPASERFCTHCEKRLRGNFVWLELDQRIDGYHDFQGVPEDRSQGWFPIGTTCAKKLRAESARKLEAQRSPTGGQ
jgi:hypothetical protein